MDLSDPRQFELAYRLHAARVRTAAQRILSDASAAEDVAQEVFIRLWQRPHLFDPTRGSLAALLSVMARSRALDGRRADGAADRARDRLAELHAVAAPTSDEGPAEALDRRVRNDELRAALLRLPAAQRETVVLSYGGELTSAEVAKRTNVGRATARSRLRLGLVKLRADLGAAA
jgi:RNA polymerase sigma-70 factor (ECF subfamily)